MNDIMQEKLVSMKSYSKSHVGPVMFLYTEWVLREAERRGLKRLYFLARDGYLLCEIAKKIVSFRKLGIECKYLYCSRQALRMPSYHIIGDEAFDLLTLGGYYLTPKSVLSRAMLNEEQTNTVLNALGISEPDKTFVEHEFIEFSKRLKENQYYRNAVLENSRRSYETTIDYFRQEGLFDTDTVAIVDSGWTGSMQRSLRQLLRSKGFEGKLLGFYFGMYVPPKSEEDGEYVNFYFDSESGFLRKIFFNNNLFECMLSATDPMTVGFESRNDTIYPIFTNGHSDELIPLIEKQIEGALEYTDKHLPVSMELSKKQACRRCYKILKRAMVYPTTKEVELLSNFMFCDDVTEGYRNSIADKSMKEKLTGYSFFPRLWRKLTGRKNNGGAEIFWVYGVIAFCPAITRPWHRLNVMLWEIVKKLLKR